ncbi:MAG: M4 family metallopeptidase [Francisellaceae bacterium]
MEIKKIVAASVLVLSSSMVFAGQPEILTNASLDAIDGFAINNVKTNTVHLLLENSRNPNTLNLIKQSQFGDQQFKRYQQTYNGIEVVGAQAIIATDSRALLINSASRVNGLVVKNLSIDTLPEISSIQAISEAVSSFNQHAEGYQVNYESTRAPVTKLQILPENNDARLIYLVSFWANKTDAQPKWMQYRIDAKTGDVIGSWDNIQNYEDTGPGGNQKVGEYWYGQDNMPYLDVTQSGKNCVMNNDRVRTVNLDQRWDNSDTTSYKYVCGENQGDAVNGGYSSVNDAHYFGDIIIDMYKDWYDINALSHADGSVMQLIMRVHYGQRYENAFWNGENMTFGDGQSTFYPLVSLDVAGHEVSHGFTEQHSGLIYSNQSGSLNEAFSDMAGQTVRAYLLSQNEKDYQRFYPHDPANQIGWGLGETIMKGSKDVALRYMNEPSKDGISADCLDKSLAGDSCKISYADVVNSSGGSQSYIVHTGSGVFNKAFYLIASDWAEANQSAGIANAYAEGVKEAFNIMLLANVKYWTPSVSFTQAACGVVI